MELTKKYDNASVRWRDQIENMRFPAAYRRLCKALPRANKAKIVDIGCGTGALTKAFCDTHSRPSSITLVDPSKPMIEAAFDQVKGNADSIQRSASSLEDFKPDVQFDVTLCAHVIEHCAKPTEALKHLTRIAKPGGHIALAVSKPHLCQVLIWLRWQHRWFSQKQVIQMGTAAGLDLVQTVTFQNGVPARVSQGFIFKKPNEGNSSCS